MAYAQTTIENLRLKAGSLLEKIYTEFGLVKTELDALAAVDAAGLKVARVALAGGNANAFAFAWPNPLTSKIIVSRVVVDVTTKSASAGSLLDVGPGATATTHSDTLIDGLDIATAVICGDNITNKGTNGLSLCKLDEAGGTTSYITGQILVQNAAALAGYVYIFYHKVS
jgi:hypothetical protein